MILTKHTIASCLPVAVAAALLLSAQPTAAYDFSALNDSGSRIYYNLLSDTEVEVTYESRLEPTFTYSGTLGVPASVMYLGREMTVKAVGDRAFYGCRTLKAVELPPSVEEIGQWAFGWCDSIARIDIPEGVKRLGADAFDGCYGLERITVGAGNSVFESTGDVVYSSDGSMLVACRPTAEGTLYVADGTVSIGPRALGGCTFVDSVRIAPGVRTIGRDAFSFCHSLRSIYLPASVEEIGDKALADCFSLERIVADEASGHFASADGTLYTADFGRLIQSPEANPCHRPHPLTKEIGPYAFLDNRRLATIALPRLTETIGEGAFAGCERLTGVVIPEGVRSIGALAFGLCDSLSNIYCLSTHPESISVGEGAFETLRAARRTLYVPRGCRGAYASAAGWKEIENIVETDALLSQSITWDYGMDRYAGDGSIELGATASSGLPVRYCVSAMSRGAASVEGNVLRPLTGGVIYVTAYQEGDSAYLPAEAVTMAYNDPAGTDVAEDDDRIRVSGGRGEIIIEGADPEAVAEVYDPAGAKVYTGRQRRIRVTGMKIYVVRIGSRTCKVAVR